MNKKVAKIAAALVVALALSGCGKDATQVPVMQVSMLSSASQNGEKFAGMVVSENTVQIPREPEKTIKTVHVKVGDTIKANDVLFSYDSEELRLALDRQNLDLERLKGTAAEKENQIAEVQKKIKSASGDERLEWDLKRLELQTDLTQAQYDQKAKEKEIESTTQLLENVDVRSPIDGSVRKIEDTNNEAYMVIQQSGSYRVQGKLNELSMNAGIREGTEVTIISRLDSTQTWQGTVSGIDYNSNAGSSDTAEASVGMMGGMMGGMSGMPGSSSYPFYVTLNDSTGLLLGQHVYIQIGTGEEKPVNQITLPSVYLVDISEDMTTAYVLKSTASGKLERHQVSLGEYNPDLDCFEITDGLSAEDFIADPSSTEQMDGVKTDPHSEQDYEAMPPEMEQDMGNGFAEGEMEGEVNGDAEGAIAEEAAPEGDGEVMPEEQVNPDGMEG